MSVNLQEQTTTAQAPLAPSQQRRTASWGDEPAVLADIYSEQTNIAIWQRELPPALQDSVSRLAASGRPISESFTVTPECARKAIRQCLAGTAQAELSEDIARLVEMFCYLFELERAGLRLKTLDRAMCPRFHVDKVPCRLITTYFGSGTEWLPHEAVDRSHLGRRSNGRNDKQTGLIRSAADIQQLRPGEVALLKGESWEGNENAGLVHRSPAPIDGEQRLLLSLDFSS